MWGAQLPPPAFPRPTRKASQNALPRTRPTPLRSRSPPPASPSAFLQGKAAAGRTGFIESPQAFIAGAARPAAACAARAATPSRPVLACPGHHPCWPSGRTTAPGTGPALGPSLQPAHTPHTRATTPHHTTPEPAARSAAAAGAAPRCCGCGARPTVPCPQGDACAASACGGAQRCGGAGGGGPLPPCTASAAPRAVTARAQQHCSLFRPCTRSAAQGLQHTWAD